MVWGTTLLGNASLPAPSEGSLHLLRLLMVSAGNAELFHLFKPQRSRNLSKKFRQWVVEKGW
jgi:hypothetical protein